MDANSALKLAREQVNPISDAIGEDDWPGAATHGDDLAEAFAWLDRHLSGGGELPAAWRR